MKIKVVGSGIIGLASAMVGAELGHDVTLFFRKGDGTTITEQFVDQVSKNSTSGAAAAFWSPFTVGQYKKSWALQTLMRYLAQAHADARDSGVFVGNVNILGRDETDLTQQLDTSLWWMDHPMVFQSGRKPTPTVLDQPINISGIAFTHVLSANVPFVEMARYIPWLTSLAIQAGVEFSPLDNYADSEFCLDAAGFDAVCLCGGGWTPRMLGETDTQLQGLLGHVTLAKTSHHEHAAGAVFKANMPDTSRPVYSVSTVEKNLVWLGGTALPIDFGLPGQTLAAANDQEIRQMQQACSMMLDDENLEFKNAIRTGIRPYRTSVRVEIHSQSNGSPVCVNYGHGGGGVSLAWGCASEAIRLIEEARNEYSVASDDPRGSLGVCPELNSVFPSRGR